MYKVTVNPEIAKLRPYNAGTRRVIAWKGTDREEMMEFSATAKELDELPPEVEADEMLVIDDGSGAARERKAKAPAKRTAKKK